MSQSPEPSWSDNPDAPVIPYRVYFQEKAFFAGVLISSILYGIVIVIFFKCMAALFNSVNRRGEPVKRGLVFYTAITFAVATVLTATNLHLFSIAYIDNRDFPGIDGMVNPGPTGYQVLISPEAVSIIANSAFALGDWLANGLLLYRCYVIYAKNFWVIAFPCLMYLASLGMGILLVYQSSIVTSVTWSALPWFSISLSLNIILTLMIVIRLILHTRTIRTAMGGSGIGGLCKAVITMLVESCALYAVSSALLIGPWGAQNTVANTFLSILPEIQVIATLLIVQRVANKSALTSNTVASGRLNDFKAHSREDLSGGSGTLDGSDLVNSGDRHGVDSGKLGSGVGVGTTTDSYQEKDV